MMLEKPILFQNNKNKKIYEVLCLNAENRSHLRDDMVIYKEKSEDDIYIRETDEFNDKFTKYEDPNQTKLELDEN